VQPVQVPDAKTRVRELQQTLALMLVHRRAAPRHVPVRYCVNVTASTSVLHRAIAIS